MSRFQVLMTDYQWPDVEIERNVLKSIDAELIVAEDTSPAGLARLAASVDAIATCWVPVPAEVIQAGTKLQIVSRLGIGLDNIDVAACTQLGIPVTNVPDYCLIEVAEHALALIFSLARKTAFFHLETKSGRYNLQSGHTLRRIEGQTLGIVGMGHIGRVLAEKAQAIGLKILAYSRSPADIAGVQWGDLPTVLSQSDYVSVHVPLSPETRHLIGAEQFALMKPTAFLINTARGGLIDHAALAAALANNQIAGAALDVQDPEPPDLSQPPWNDPRVIITPHAAFNSIESLENLRTRTAGQIVDRLSGRVPEHVVNPEVLS